MPNVKAQSSNEFSNFKVQIGIGLLFGIWISTFEIYCGLKITYLSFSRYNG
jgi:hypothetical protein